MGVWAVPHRGVGLPSLPLFANRTLNIEPFCVSLVPLCVPEAVGADKRHDKESLAGTGDGLLCA